MKQKLSAAVFFAAVTVLAFAASAGAVDGTIEINQAVVMQGGTSPCGSTAGFPCTISNPGTYRLTGPLTLSGNGDAIHVTVNHVTIDLNGFAITVTGPSSSGSGINGNVAELRVENGTITNFAGGYGILAGAQAIIRNVQADANKNGIQTGNNSVIQGCTAAANGNNGIYCNGNGCVISANTANSNFIGIYCYESGCLISGNTAISNSEYGIYAADLTTGYGGNVLKNTTNVSNGTSMGNNVCTTGGTTTTC